MAVTIHAVLLMTIPVVTAIICLFGSRRKPPKLGRAAIIAGSTTFLVLSLFLHLCDSGDPDVQCIIIGASMWFMLTYSGSKWIQSGLCVAMVIAMVALSQQYVSLVHSSEWFGHPRLSKAVTVINESRLSHVKNRLKEASQNDSTSYPKGWLRNMSLATTIENDLKEKPYRYEIHRAWHSWYTKLYPRLKIEQDFWYPGGRLSDAADAIVLKDAS